MTEAGGRTVGGCVRAFFGVVATMVALIVLPIVIGGIFFGLIHVGFLSGWEAQADLRTPIDLGISGPQGGPILAKVPTCYKGKTQMIVVFGQDDAVIWRAAAASPQSLDQFFIGMPPEGFADFEPMSGQLDTTTSYTVQVVPRVVEGVDLDTEGDLLVSLTGGATATFRPADLQPDKLWVDGDTISQKDFDEKACD